MRPLPVVTAVLGDLTAQAVDVVVNAANHRLRGGGGVDGAIHAAGGPAILRDCIARFPKGLPTGEAGWTTAGDLPARWVVHTVGPNYNASERDRSLLESCYRRSLEIAEELGARSIAFPLISAGIYGWPLRDAIAAAVEAVTTSGAAIDDVRLVVLDPGIHQEVRRRLSRWTPRGVLHGVRALHERGCHGVRVFPGMSPSGMYWRATVTAPSLPADEVSSAPRPTSPTISYSTADLTTFAGGEVTAGTAPEDVADLIIAALPHRDTTVDDPEYVAWFAGLLELVDRHDALPIAHADWFDASKGWEIGWGSGLRYPGPPAPR
ncbi:MAG: O-acetyl-ADP-ribose deacetylase [Actinomycetota bacterium]|nr:O-acetyl-ADP-ribose deacetylase [Actinomycetota bacterium]